MTNGTAEQIVAFRLRRTRIQLGLTQQEVARAVGFRNAQSIVYIEKGRQAVRVSELVRFARLFNRSVDFLLGVDDDGPEPVVLWRDQSEAASARAAEARFVRYCRDYSRLEELAGRRSPSFGLTCDAKPTTYEAADSMGEEYAQKMKLGARPASGLLAALEEQQGVKLFSARLEAAGSAASTRGTFGSAIMLNCLNARVRRNYDAAHEVFHLATWDLFPTERVHCASGGRRSRVEVMANRFASALLMPAKAVKAELRTRAPRTDWSCADYVTLAREFRVSAEAMIWRLVVLGEITEDRARHMVSSPEFRAAKRTESASMVEDESCLGHSARFIALAYECLAKGRLSKMEFARQVGVKLCDVNQFLANWGYSTAEGDEAEAGPA